MGDPDPDLRIAARKPIVTLTPADRIKELNTIDASIAQLLHTAGEVLQILGSNSPATNLASAKSTFLDSVTTYFTILSSIDVRLRRQVYALQEAGLIAEGSAKDSKRGASAAGIAGAGAGRHFDMGWVNNGGNEVDRDMEREVWKRARGFVERFMGEGSWDERMENNLEAENMAGVEQDNTEEVTEKKDV